MTAVCVFVGTGRVACGCVSAPTSSVTPRHSGLYAGSRPCMHPSHIHTNLPYPTYLHTHLFGDPHAVPDNAQGAVLVRARAGDQLGWALCFDCGVVGKCVWGEGKCVCVIKGEKTFKVCVCVSMSIVDLYVNEAIRIPAARRRWPLRRCCRRWCWWRRGVSVCDRCVGLCVNEREGGVGVTPLHMDKHTYTPPQSTRDAYIRKTHTGSRRHMSRMGAREG